MTWNSLELAIIILIAELCTHNIIQKISLFYRILRANHKWKQNYVFQLFFLHSLPPYMKGIVLGFRQIFVCLFQTSPN